MLRVSPRTIGDGSGAEFSVTVAETRACAKDFVVGAWIRCAGGTAVEGDFTVNVISVCQSKVMAGLTTVVVQTGNRKRNDDRSYCDQEQTGAEGTLAIIVGVSCVVVDMGRTSFVYLHHFLYYYKYHHIFSYFAHY